MNVSEIRIGDRVLVQSLLYWEWRHGIEFWGTVIDILRFDGVAGSDAYQFRVRWDLRKFYLFVATNWVDGSDIKATERRLPGGSSSTNHVLFDGAAGPGGWVAKPEQPKAVESLAPPLVVLDSKRRIKTPR